MRALKVKTGREYEIKIDGISNAGRYIAEIYKNKKIAVITDDTVYGLYYNAVSEILMSAGFETCVYHFKPGENFKSLQTISEIYSFLSENKITRTELIVALGGGIVGDVAGFAASTYLRGIRCAQIPTTLLAAVDSSVGGKTGVNTDFGKNLVGSFWQPSLVVCDTEFLKTLPRDFYLDGVAEIIKYGLIQDSALFDRVSNGIAPDALEDIIYRCVEIKSEIVSKDERESGLRMLLNFGHTLGHAIEKHSSYKVSHGKAVAAGMSIISGLEVSNGFMEHRIACQINECLVNNGLSVSYSAKNSELLGAALSDKKMDSDSINLVLLKNIGEAYVKKMSISEFEKFLNY